MTIYTVECSMYAGVQGRVELPEGKTWADVQNWYVKWDIVCISFKDGTEADLSLNSDGVDAIDWKHPQSVTVYATDPETEETDYDTIVAEQG